MNYRVLFWCLTAALIMISGCRSAPGENIRRSEFDHLSQRVTSVETSVRTLESLHPDLPRAVSGPLDALSTPGGPAVPAAYDLDAAPAGKKASSGEKADYQRGQSLLKQKKYDQAAAVFSQMLVDYPSGRLAPNAAYWLGECHYASGRFSEAAAAFQNTADQYPDSAKAPDAMMKLSCSHDRLGDNARAMAVMDILLARYPASNAAKMYYNGEGCFRR